MKKIYNQKGMTLVEMMVAGAITVATIMVSLSLQKTLSKSQKKSKSFVNQKQTTLQLRKMAVKLAVGLDEDTIDPDLFYAQAVDGQIKRFGTGVSNGAVNSYLPLLNKNTAFALSNKVVTGATSAEDRFEHLVTICIPIEEAQRKLVLDDVEGNNLFRRGVFVTVLNDYKIIKCCPKNNPNCTDGYVNGISGVDGAGAPISADVNYITRIYYRYDNTAKVTGVPILKSIPAIGDHTVVTGAGVFNYIPIDVIADDPPTPLEKVIHGYYTYNNECINKRIIDPDVFIKKPDTDCQNRFSVDMTISEKDISREVDVGVTNLGDDIDF